MKFTDETSDFRASFIANTAIAQPTIVYLNGEYWYSTGYTLQVSTIRGQVLKEGVDYTLDASQPNYAKVLLTNSKLNG